MSLVEANQTTLFLFDKSGPTSAGIRSEIESGAAPASVESFEIEAVSKLSSFSDAHFDAIVAFTESSESTVAFAELWRILKPQGSLKLLVAFERTFAISQALTNSLTLAGFINQTTASHNNYILVTVQKPNYVAGATQAIKLKKKPVADAWSAQTTGNEALIDESSLLSAEDLAKPKLVDDCEVGTTKKACKGCTCGRADEEDKGAKRPKVTLAMLENPAVDSSCGSCSLGDAFRCGGCPYAGLPAFKPGEKIVLPDDFDMDIIEG